MNITELLPPKSKAHLSDSDLAVEALVLPSSRLADIETTLRQFESTEVSQTWKFCKLVICLSFTSSRSINWMTLLHGRAKPSSSHMNLATCQSISQIPELATLCCWRHDLSYHKWVTFSTLLPILNIYGRVDGHLSVAFELLYFLLLLVVSNPILVPHRELT